MVMEQVSVPNVSTPISLDDKLIEKIIINYAVEI